MVRNNSISITVSILILFAINTTPVSAGEKEDVVFPALSGYELKIDFPVYNPDNLWEYINGGAYTYLNYSFVDVHIAEYVKGETIIKAEIYQHKNSIYAFGIYAQERSPDYSFIDIGVQGYAENTLVNFVKGAWYVKIICNDGDETTATVLLELANLIENSLEGITQMPDLFLKFPKEGKIVNSESYISTEFLGYGFMPGVFVTSYKYSGEEFKLFIINAISDDNANEVFNKLKSKSESSKKQKHGAVLLNDKYNGAILVKKRDRFIYGCIDSCNIDLFRKFTKGE